MTRSPAQVLAAMGEPRVLVVGDLVLDRYLRGAVERISPEAPIQVLRVEHEEERLGCAGSVAALTAVLGARTTLVGVLGDDAGAARVRALCAEAGATLDAVTEENRRTGVKTRHLARSHSRDQQVLRVDEETLGPPAMASQAALRARLDVYVPESDVVIVSDYGKGTLTPSVLAALLAAAHGAGVPVVVDPKGRDFSRYRGATCITPNRTESRVATGVEVTDLAAAERAADALIASAALSFVLVTLDREGMYLKAAGDEGVHLTTTPREVFDVTGAGDMVVAVLGMALASGARPVEAAALANVAAGLEVEHVGVVPITREEIADRLVMGVEGLAAKHVARSEIEATVARHRAAKKRIVFTNGCFDILHAGHVRYLAQAKARGDVLIVGLNADASVTRLKGEGRPVNAEADRIEVLAALAAVDHVVVFDEDVPTPLIEQVQPDVLAKGMDWKDKGVAGREIVEARGGEVVLLDLHEGRSTTGIVDRIRGA